MIRFLAFDVDGVLVNAEMFSRRLAREHRIPDGDIAPFFKGPFTECLIGTADLKEVLPQSLEQWGWTKGVNAFLDYWFTSEHVLNQDLVQHIQALRAQGIRCVVATNNEKYRVAYMLTSMGFRESFDRLYASCDLGHRKPAAQFYSAMLQDVGADATEVLLFDDTPANVDAARACGMNAELYTSFDEFKHTMHRYRQGDAEDVLDLLLTD